MVKLGGREFQPVDQSTIEWDFTLYSIMQGAGLSDIVLHEGEQPEQLAQRIYRSVLASGSAFDMLGCLLVPAAVDPLTWSPALMRETAAFVRQLSDPADKQEVSRQIVGLITGFFHGGLLSITTSPTRSSAPDLEAVPHQQPGSRRPQDSSTSASGP
ncbi:MAG: hypothetical protein JSR67_03660 [Proteobacteria bacterium]|nr:hypothetical protein [Pseudomonadota bacterium]